MPTPTLHLEIDGSPSAFAPTPTLTVGTSQDCDIVLDDIYASNEHAVFHFDPPTWTIRDLGSTNTTQVNHVKVYPPDPTPVRAGDHILIGRTHILVASAPAQRTPRDVVERVLRRNGVTDPYEVAQEVVDDFTDAYFALYRDFECVRMSVSAVSVSGRTEDGTGWVALHPQAVGNQADGFKVLYSWDEEYHATRGEAIAYGAMVGRLQRRPHRERRPRLVRVDGGTPP